MPDQSNQLKKEDLRFRVAYSERVYADAPDIHDVDWDGGEPADVSYWATLDIVQFARLCRELDFTAWSATQGMLVAPEIAAPAVDLYHCDQDFQCYVTVYTERELEAAKKQASKPQVFPYVQNDFSVTSIKFAFASLWGDAWPAVQEVLASLLPVSDWPYRDTEEDDVDHIWQGIHGALANSQQKIEELKTDSPTVAGT